MNDPNGLEDLLASLERLAERFPREELRAMWDVVDALRGNRDDLEACLLAAEADADELDQDAARANEGGPGLHPEDNPGPLYWSRLAYLTRAASLSTSDLARAQHYARMAEDIENMPRAGLPHE